MYNINSIKILIKILHFDMKKYIFLNLSTTFSYNNLYIICYKYTTLQILSTDLKSCPKQWRVLRIGIKLFKMY